MNHLFRDLFATTAVLLVLAAIIWYGPKTPPPLELSNHPYFAHSLRDNS